LVTVHQEVFMGSLKRLSELLSNIFTGIGGVSLVLMTSIACVNMFLRLWGTPLSPAYELVSYLGATTVALPLGYAQLKKSHIAVDILSTHFPTSVRKATTAVSLFLSTILFGLGTWKVAQHATNFMQTGELSETTRMPFYPFTYAVSVSCGLLTFCLLVDLLTVLMPSQEKNK
jgi:TRAP-type C4-dicarboxylate transport system permease small subunit